MKTETPLSESFVTIKVIADLTHKLKIATEALHQIANEDFRGNRPQSAVIAYNVLKKINENN